MDIRKIFLLTVIVTIVFFFTRCFHAQTVSDPRGIEYAGSNKCMSCHKSISDSYTHTAHFISTRVADESTVTGNFSKDSNELIIDDTTRIIMEKRDSGLYQVLYINNKETVAHRFDLVMGAVKGQSYLYWQGNGFFEMPVSYFSYLQRWTSSPGYSFANFHFNRPVVNECFMCHSSFASGDPHGLSVSGVHRNNWVFNIDCERCHGPAAAHVQFHEEHPEEKKAMYMVSFQSLSRAQKIDLCAVCHSGTKHILLKSTFAFKMGDTLTSYMVNLPNIEQELDVHGNQTQLLSESKCFRMSAMDCSTCHNTHVNQRGFVKSFNDHCQRCHSQGQHFCGMATDSNTAFIQNNCTRCHMPAQASRAIVVQTAKNTLSIPTMVVNHHIAIYQEETEKIRKTMANGKNIK
jgi:hypothetical protein